MHKAFLEITDDYFQYNFTFIHYNFRSNPEIRASKEKQVYFIKDAVACSPKSLFKILWEDSKLWNKQITDFKVSIFFQN